MVVSGIYWLVKLIWNHLFGQDFPLYGVCPLYDDCVLARCDICQLVLKVSQLADHLGKLI